MSAQTNYLRGEINGLLAQLNNQSARLAAVSAINEGLALLDARDTQERNGMPLAPLDQTVLANLHGSVESAINAVNAKTVTVKPLATIASELPPEE